MDPLKFLFKLIENFVPIDTQDFRQIKTEATTWVEGITNDSKNPLQRGYMFISDRWYLKLLLAILYIPAARMLFKANKIEDDE